MAKGVRNFAMLLFALVLVTSMLVTGCTRYANEEQLTALDETDAGRVLAASWYELSGYCHHHAYELSPTASQVRGVVATVLRISASRAPGRHP